MSVMARTWMVLPLLLLQLTAWRTVEGQCAARTFDHDSFVCVCNATYCDEPGILEPPAAGTYAVYTSTRDGDRLTPSSGVIEAETAAASVSISVDTSTQYQTMIGFGGAFTDAAALSFNTLSEETRDMALRSFFAPEGIEYSVCRVPIGSSDFSARPYSLDDVDGDVELKYWSLQPEDIEAKIPNILRAMEFSAQDVFIFGSPWSPPAWMKTDGMVSGAGALRREMWQPYANYMVKFVEAYEAAGVPMWGLTPQNEPQADEVNWGINTCRWPPEDMRDWIRDYLGPSLETAGYRRVKMMVDDFNRDTLPWYIQPMLEDPECSKYIDGVAVHWYSDPYVSPDVLDQTHDLDPTKFILYTEACEGFDKPNDESVLLGDWYRGQHYLQDILENINHWATGWVDWNIALNTQGGPNWSGGAMDSPIIIDAETDEVYKQPMFYALAHVSKFMKRGSVRVATAVSEESMVHSASVIDADGSVAVVVLNTDENAVDVSISIDGTRFINTALPAKSFQTFWVPAE